MDPAVKINGKASAALWALALALSCALFADATISPGNPYRTIASRNAFHLRSAEIQPAKSVPVPVLLPIVFLTGVTDVGGNGRALLEIQEPGKSVSKPILAEGEVSGIVEVLRVDARLGRVKVRIGDAETNLTFEPAKPLPPQTPSALVPHPRPPAKPL